MRRRHVLVSLPAMLLPGISHAQATGIIVFAAASLTDVLSDISKLWQAGGNPPLRLSLAASSTLARQIEQGAPAEIFASADEQWADWLQTRNLLVPGSRKDLLTNSLVIVVPKSAAREIQVDAKLDLAALLGPTGRLAIGDPTNVPAGVYAKQAFTRLGLWSAVESRLASSDSVRSALLLVERGEAPAGVVYATDVAVSPSLMIAGTFPPASHDPITYPFALVKGGDTEEARAFLGFLSGPQARLAFEHRGFGFA